MALTPSKKTNQTSQYIDNLSYDEEFNVRVTEMLGYDPSTGTLRRMTVAANGGMLFADEALIQATDSSYDYYAKAAPGTSASAGTWKAFRLSKTTGIKDWADGNANYDNTPGAAGVNLPGLSYS